MSVINRMLRELDRRNAAADETATPVGVVAPVDDTPHGREWFWRSVALLMLAAVVWVVWVAYQLRPRPIVTDAAFMAANAARKPELQPAPKAAAQSHPPAHKPEAPAPVAAPPPVPKLPDLPASPSIAVAPSAPPVAPAVPEPPVVQVPVFVAPVQAPKPAPPKPAAVVPVPPVAPPLAAVAPAPLPKPVLSPRPVPAAPEPVVIKVDPSAVPRASAPRLRSERVEPQARLQIDLPQAKILPSPPPRGGSVEKRDLKRPPAELADAEFRRAVALLDQSRVSEGEDGLAAALAQDPSHENARQALVSIMFERNRVDDARRLLQQGLALNPANATFAIGLARLHAERREYANALDVLQGAQSSAALRADYHALSGAILQRMGRNNDAIESYSRALKIAPASGTAWVGMGISLEALERHADAAESFRRAIGTGTLTPEVRDFAEQRSRKLR